MWIYKKLMNPYFSYFFRYYRLSIHLPIMNWKWSFHLGNSKSNETLSCKKLYYLIVKTMLPLFADCFFQKPGPPLCTTADTVFLLQDRRHLPKHSNRTPPSEWLTERLEHLDPHVTASTKYPVFTGGQGQAGDLTMVVEQLVRKVTPHKNTSLHHPVAELATSSPSNI